MSNTKVLSKRNGCEIGATRANESSLWQGYVQLDDGVVYFDSAEGRRMADQHQSQADEYAASLNAPETAKEPPMK